jgi:hypothetical protein
MTNVSSILDLSEMAFERWICTIRILVLGSRVVPVTWIVQGDCMLVVEDQFSSPGRGQSLQV